MLTTTGFKIAPWLHEEAGTASDPINLLFKVKGDQNPLQAVVKVLSSTGWIPTTKGDHQYIYYNDTRFRENTQYEKNPSWLPGIPSVGHIFFRYHLRLWYEPSLDGRVIGGVHLEIFSNGHEVISFDEAKREIADDFYRARWQIRHDAYDLHNDWMDSHSLSVNARFLNAVGRRSQPALARMSSLCKSTRDRFLGNGYVTLMEY